MLNVCGFGETADGCLFAKFVIGPWQVEKCASNFRHCFGILRLPGGLEGKDLPAVRETQVQSLGWDDPLEEGMATHSCILAWRIPWTEEPGRLQSMGSQRFGHD